MKITELAAGATGGRGAGRRFKLELSADIYPNTCDAPSVDASVAKAFAGKDWEYCSGSAGQRWAREGTHQPASYYSFGILPPGPWLAEAKVTS